MSIAGPPLWDKSTGEWKGIIPNVVSLRAILRPNAHLVTLFSGAAAR